MTRAQIVDGWRIEITVRDGVAKVLPQAVIGRVVVTALRAGGAPSHASLTVVLTDDAELADLNAAHLGHEGPTDVLSFPLLPPAAYPPHAGRVDPDTAPRHAGRVDLAPDLGIEISSATEELGAVFALPPGARIHLGDVAVSVERAVDQASAGRGGQTGDVRWSPADELRLLLTHGTLHVCGWDHVEPVEEAAMRALEHRLLGINPN